MNASESPKVVNLIQTFVFLRVVQIVFIALSNPLNL